MGSEPLVMQELRGRVVLVEFWDFCRPHSLHTLPYLKLWHSRYAGAGLVVVGVHTPGFRASADEGAVRAAVRCLGIEYPVLLDGDYAFWNEYENEGWPGRYVWNAAGMLADFHYGEGDYDGCEAVICELLGVACPPFEALRPEDEPGARLAAPSEDRLEEPFSGPYEAGEAWAVLAPRRGGETVRVNGVELVVEHPGAYLLIHHPRHALGELEIELGAGVRCDGICFTPGLL